MNCSKPDLDTSGIELEGGVPFGKKQLSMKRVDANKASEHPGMKKFINQVKGKSIKTKTIGLANQRNVNEIQTFKLQMTDIVMIEKAGYTSFTFAVIKDDDQGKMENIIVNYYSNGDVKSYLVMYDVNEAEREMLRQGIMVSLDDKTVTYLLENFIDQVGDENTINSAMYDFNMCAQWTSTQISSSCPSGGHNGDNYYDCIYYTGVDDVIKPRSWVPSYSWVDTVTFVPCLGAGDGFIPNPGGSNPPDNNVNPEEEEEEIIDDGLNWNITFPVPPKKSPHEKNCEKLNQQSQAIIESLTDLSSKTDVDYKEFGYSHTIDDEGNYNSTELCNQIPCTTVTSDPFTIPFPDGENAVAVSHTHPDDGKGYLLFSPQDINYFFNLAYRHQTANDQPKKAEVYTFYVVTARGNYALKIENYNQFRTFMLTNYNDDFKNKLLERYRELNPQNDISFQEKVFLNFIKDEMPNSGLSIYKSTDDTFSSWNKLELETTGNINLKPCN